MIVDPLTATEVPNKSSLVRAGSLSSALGAVGQPMEPSE